MFLKIVRVMALIACILVWIPVFFNIGDTDMGIYKVVIILIVIATIALFFIGDGSGNKKE